MRIAHKLALLLALAVAAVAVSATAAFATSASVDPTETATVITVNGTASTTGTGATGNPSGSYTAHSTNARLDSDATPDPTCDSDATFTIDVTGDGAITNLTYTNCDNSCSVGPVTIADGGFTVTGRTETNTAQATFVLDGSDGRADLTGTVTCLLAFTCTFTTDTSNTTATLFVATVGEGNPGTLSFDDATVETDTILCTNARLTADYTLDDPTTAGTDDLTVSP